MTADAVDLYTKIAAELERAAAYCRVAAQYDQDREIPRGAAHGLAADGHVVKAQALLNDMARHHAERSTTEV
jgi:hypothetical protein